ncbi:unnamed protein product, partial [Mesorhabditis belari]|uniref:Cytochrome P450 n=1 Tax=Mesorhabditis belari TaxID=2138241 RepID=A0AAF3J6Q1_9BILA
MFLLIIFICIAIYAFIQWQAVRKLPNGPIPFLFFGNLPQLMFYSYKKGGLVGGMVEMAKIYGDVHTVWYGPYPTIQLCTFEMAKELMVNQGTTQIGRYTPFFTRAASYDEKGNQRGVVSSEGDQWLEHRRFILHTLRDFGMGNALQEQLIYHEIDYHFGEIEKRMIDGKATVVVDDFTELLIASIINRLLYGYGFDESNQSRYFEIRDEVAKFIKHLSPIDFFVTDWWRYVPILKNRYFHIYNVLDAFRAFSMENIQKIRSQLSDQDVTLSGEQAGDFVHAYLIEQRKRIKENGEPGYFDDAGLLGDLVDIWGAGQETTSTTLQWAFHELLSRPEIVEKCRNEINEVTGDGRVLCLKDRPKTPYLNAVINEIQRYGSILSVNLWRVTTGPCHIGGCEIPVGTLSTAQLSVIMQNDRVFDQPQEFNPERYLGNDGKLQEQSTIPFGIGKRACLGESLARAELYLVLGNLLQRYKLSFDPMEGSQGMTNKYSPIYKPKTFKAVFEKI